MIGHLVTKLFGVIRLKPKRTPCIIIVFELFRTGFTPVRVVLSVSPQ